MTVELKVYVQMTLTKTQSDTLMAMMQNEIYEDETAAERGHREHIFTRIQNGQVLPAGRVKVREEQTTFSLFEPAAKWLVALCEKPIYDDESKKEGEFRLFIKQEFWCPNIEALHKSIHSWDDIPF